METTATTTQNIDRTQLEVRDGVTSINNVMYDKLVANDTHIREADSRRGSCESNLDQDVKYPRKQSDCEHLLKKPSNLPSVSEVRSNYVGYQLISHFLPYGILYTQVTGLHKCDKQGINQQIFFIGNRFQVTLRILSPKIALEKLRRALQQLYVHRNTLLGHASLSAAH